jgi:hypothetical protein
LITLSLYSAKEVDLTLQRVFHLKQIPNILHKVSPINTILQSQAKLRERSQVQGTTPTQVQGIIISSLQRIERCVKHEENFGQ